MSQSDPWATVARTTGIVGLAGMVLLFGPIIAMSSLGEPAFDATQEEAAAFLRNTAEASWVVSGVGLALSRFAWTTNAWLLPYALFWIWVIAVCVRLVRKPA